MESENKVLNIKPPVWGLALATIVVVFLVVFLAILSWNEIKKHDYIGRESQQIYTIAITGEGKVTAIPDVATINLGIITESSSIVNAQKENSEKMNTIIKTLKEKMEIDEKDVKTSSYSISPKYDWSDGRQRIIGYIISQSVAVKVRDLEKISDILGMAAGGGANNVSGPNFTIDEQEKLQQEAREKALANAKEKAEALAKVAGVKLGKLVSFSENVAAPYPFYQDYSLKSFGLGGAAEAAPAVEPGSQDVIVNVMVTYEVL